MKTSICLVSAIILTASLCSAQFKKGDVELSFSGSLGSWNPPSASGFHSESEGYFSLYVVPGYYLIDGLSLEPEIGFMAMKYSKPSEYLLLNLSYTYSVPESRLGVFARAGFGVSNSMEYPFASGVVLPASEAFNVLVLNLGVGMKFLVSQNVLVRMELNYKKHSWNEKSANPYYSYDYDFTESAIGMNVGFSIIL